LEGQGKQLELSEAFVRATYEEGQAVRHCPLKYIIVERHVRQKVASLQVRQTDRQAEQVLLLGKYPSGQLP